jgi:hypothetical protein
MRPSVIPSHWSASTLGTLRNVNLLQGGQLDGVAFVRCIPFGGRDLSPAERTAIVCKAEAEINEPGVFLANNPEFGGDYLRVDRDTAAYRAICHLKS